MAAASFASPLMGLAAASVIELPPLPFAQDALEPTDFFDEPGGDLLGHADRHIDLQGGISSKSLPRWVREIKDLACPIGGYAIPWRVLA